MERRGVVIMLAEMKYRTEQAIPVAKIYIFIMAPHTIPYGSHYCANLVSFQLLLLKERMNVALRVAIFSQQILAALSTSLGLPSRD